jgi:hypothetical protein
LHKTGEKVVGEEDLEGLLDGFDDVVKVQEVRADAIHYEKELKTVTKHIKQKDS